MMPAIVVGLLLPRPAAAVERAAVDRAIARGVTALRALQRPNGTWQHDSTAGATALAALTLLEAGVPANDRGIVAAANFVRQEALTTGHTYTVSLSLLLLDRLGDPTDEELIESLAARLVAGQMPNGAWTYQCPRPNVDEQRRIVELRSKRVPPERSEPPPPPTEEPEKKDSTPKQRDPEEFRARILRLNGGFDRNEFGAGGDHSNTQFATLAIWVARRHGLPVDTTIRNIAVHYLGTQNADGGWAYGATGGHMSTNSSPAMTCAGLLGLAVAHGVVAELIAQKREKNPEPEPKDEGDGGTKPKDKSNLAPDPGKDPSVIRGFVYVSQSVGTPLGVKGLGEGGPRGRLTGNSYYFLWSLERVAVAYGLDTIGKRDWYSWGAELLLLSQNIDGTWNGDQLPNSGVDTCFAILFLRRANLARDLSARLRDRVRDPGKVTLRAGGAGGSGLVGKDDGSSSSDLSPITKVDPPRGTSPKSTPEVPKPPVNDNSPSGRLAAELIALPVARQAAKIEWMRDQKGVAYTEALSAAIPQLGKESRAKARDALANRIARLKIEFVTQYLEDEDSEIRRAAALACAIKESKPSIPRLIEVLRDPQINVVHAAHAALKDLSGKDFGPSADDEASRKRAIAEWSAWWKQNRKREEP